MCKIFLTLLVTNLFLIQSLHSNNQNKDFTYANFHLKWIYEGYLFPLQLEKRIETQSTNDFKWYKYSEKVYIDDINEQSQEYLTLNTKNTTKLSILEYNFTTHEQLSSYEPKLNNDLMHDYTPISHDYTYDFFSENLTDIFTLVYMKSHILVLNRFEETTDVSCVVKVMMPINTEFINEKNFNLLQKFLYIKIVFKETRPPGLHKSNRDKRKRKQQKRFKRRINPKRKLPTTFIEVELKEGPFTVNTKDFKTNNVTCTLGLIDYDDTISYEETIYELINVLDRNKKNKNDDEEDEFQSNEKAFTNSYNNLFSTRELNLNFCSQKYAIGLFEYTLIFLFNLLYNFYPN